MSLFHHKQPISAQGATYANSFTQTMKGQSLDIWDMFTRESLQNSWDARDKTSDEDGVSFQINYTELSPSKVSVLRNDIFGTSTPGLQKLESALRQDSLSLLFVCDSGTNGLRGPSTATSSYDGAEDFVSFVRNIGRSNSKELAGGTYGFGKGVFFIISEVSTVLVYTRTTDENGSPVNRFIAMANGDSFDIDGVPYTGRHWWGLRGIEETHANRTEYAEPLTGSHADRLASMLGMSDHFTPTRPTGTCIAVLNPNFNESPEQGLVAIARSLTRWAWPHMIAVNTGMDPIDFRVSYNDKDIEIPNPLDDAALKHFVDMYEEALKIKPNSSLNVWTSSFRHRVAEVFTERPKKKIGNLAVINVPKSIPKDRTVIGEEISSHIATMRNPRMVVEYYDGPRPLSGANYCGVFIADPAADEVFARSEPAAHHEWNHQTSSHDPRVLERFWGSDKKTRTNPVRVFFKQLRQLLADEGRGSNSSSDSENFASLSKLSSRLGASIANARGGTDLRTPRKKPSTPSRRPPATSVSKPSAHAHLTSLQRTSTHLEATFNCEIFIPSGGSDYQVTPNPFLDSDRGKITAKELIEAGLQAPEFLGWGELSPTQQGTSPTFAPGHHKVTARFLQPANSALGITFDFEAASAMSEGSDA